MNKLNFQIAIERAKPTFVIISLFLNMFTYMRQLILKFLDIDSYLFTTQLVLTNCEHCADNVYRRINACRKQAQSQTHTIFIQRIAYLPAIGETRSRSKSKLSWTSNCLRFNIAKCLLRIHFQGSSILCLLRYMK
jgi:hypothetical protein